MGICYSEEQQWQAYSRKQRRNNLKKRKQKSSSVIYQERSIYESSFSEQVYHSFRNDLFRNLSQIGTQGNSIGSLLEGSELGITQNDMEMLYRSLQKINPLGQEFQGNQSLSLCNIQTKNFLHTHKLKHPDLKHCQQISCCPYTSNHIVQYDIWKFIFVSGANKNQIEGQSQVFIYHPFTQRFMVNQKGMIGGSEQKMKWKVRSFGRMRNGGFVKIFCEQGELCMSQNQGLMANHMKLEICNSYHPSHLWQLSFVEMSQF